MRLVLDLDCHCWFANRVAGSEVAFVKLPRVKLCACGMSAPNQPKVVYCGDLMTITYSCIIILKFSVIHGSTPEGCYLLDPWVSLLVKKHADLVYRGPIQAVLGP